MTGAAGLTITWPAFGQGPGPAPITATKLTGRIAVLSGAGGNVGVLVGNDGLLLIDGGIANRAMDIVAASPTRDFDMRIGVTAPEAFVRQAFGGVLAARRAQ